MQAETLLKDGKPAEALKALQDAVRANPASAPSRVFLFQLLCIQGDWGRALTQLNVAADLDAKAIMMAQVCRPAIACEVLRAEIFAGKRSPLILGEPQPWVGWMVEALRATAAGQFDRAADLRASAFEQAPATPGQIDGQPFEWIADADERLGPILEVIMDGRYYWAPFANISEIVIDEPTDLRDVVWVPAQFTWSNGGKAVGLIPGRYPGTESSPDDAARLGRKTDWVPAAAGSDMVVGIGQRLLATDQGEYPLLQVRRIVLGSAAGDQSGGAS